MYLGSAFIRDEFHCRCHGLSLELNDVSSVVSEFLLAKANNLIAFSPTKIQLRVICYTQKSLLVGLTQFASVIPQSGFLR